MQIVDASPLTYQNFLFKSPFKLKKANKVKEQNDDKEIYYSMKNAINYLFQKIQNETLIVKTSREPFLLYEDCSILIIMKQLSIKNSNRVIATFQTTSLNSP